MIVRVLYFDGCPNHAPVVQLAKSVANELGLDASVQEIKVRNQQEAEQLRFFGSPTIQVDGVDIEPEARSRTDFSFSCRMYGHSGQPSRDLMKAAMLDGGKAAKPSPMLYATGGSVLAALIASACCWIPPLLLLIGVSAGGVSTAFASVRPWFLGGAFVLLGIAFYLSYLRNPVCEPGSACATPNKKLVRFNRAMLWVAFVAVLAFAFFPKYFGLAVGDGTAVLSPDSAKVTLAIDGMSCESCASGIQKSLREVPGVFNASVTYQDNLAVVAIDPNSPPKTDALVEAVEKAGFHVTEIN